MGQGNARSEVQRGVETAEDEGCLCPDVGHFVLQERSQAGQGVLGRKLLQQGGSEDHDTRVFVCQTLFDDGEGTLVHHQRRVFRLRQVDGMTGQRALQGPHITVTVPRVGSHRHHRGCHCGDG